jgi:hypothetical protein
MKSELQTIFNQSTGEKKHKQINDISKKTLKIELLTKEKDILIDKIKKIKEKVDLQTADAKEKMCKSKEEYIFLLISKLNQKGFTLWERDLVIMFINEEYDLLMDLEYISDTLKIAIEKLTMDNISKMNKFEKKIAENIMREMMEEMNIDSSAFSFEEMNTPDFKKKIETEAKSNFEKQQAEQKEKEKEKLVAKTDIDFQKLYKKLVKISHPDLYKNESEKEVKETQMKSLTLAWETRDYYQILMLWLQIDPENTVELELNVQNHKKIIAQLNEKIKNLEFEQYQIKNYYKDSAFYYQSFYANTEKSIDNKIKQFKESLEITTERTIANTILFQKTTELKKQLKEVYDRREIENQMFGNVFDNF